MSSAALELVKIALQAYGSGDPEITIELCGPQVRWDERASRPDGELVWGQEEVLRAMRRYRKSWEEYRFDVEKIAEVAPGRIVGLCRERGRGEGGVPVDRRYGGLWVVEDARIASWATYLTPKEAVGAAREVAEPSPAAAGGKAPRRKRAAGTAKTKTATAPASRTGPAKVKPRAKPKVGSKANATPKATPAATDPADFSEKQRDAAKRRAALSRAAREGARRSPSK